MCKILVLEVQGANKSRGFRVMETKSGDIFGVTEYDMKRQLKEGQLVLGLTIDKNDRVVLDKEKMFMQNVMIETSLVSVKPMVESPANVLYTLVSVEDGKYNLVSSRFSRMQADEFKMRAMLELGMIAGGAKLDGDKIVVSELLVKKPDVVKEVAKK